jgi:WD40 repeat protein
MQQIRNMSGHSDRVCSLSWNSYLLSSGSKDTKIFNHDVRLRNQLVHKLSGHSQEVCALKWSFDGSLLASGGNDNLLCIWDINMIGTNNSNRFTNNNLYSAQTGSISNSTNGLFHIRNNNLLNNDIDVEIPYPHNTSSIWNIIEENDEININPNNYNSICNEIFPKYVFTQHEAAVKALAWCPWQKGLLASGGGAKDKSIKFWNTDTGSLINSVETGSQVCSLIWDKHEKEIISSHGYSKHQISIWKYPSMNKITELNGHMSRVLYLSISPDGCSIVSGAGDETLRFWKIHDNKKIITNDYSDYKSSNSKITGSFQLR